MKQRVGHSLRPRGIDEGKERESVWIWWLRREANDQVGKTGMEQIIASIMDWSDSISLKFAWVLKTYTVIKCCSLWFSITVTSPDEIHKRGK